MRDAGEGRVISLEGGCHLALDEGSAADDVIEACLDLRRHLSVRSPQVHQRYRRDQDIPKNIVTDGPVVTKANADGMLWMQEQFLI